MDIGWYDVFPLCYMFIPDTKIPSLAVMGLLPCLPKK